MREIRTLGLSPTQTNYLIGKVAFSFLPTEETNFQLWNWNQLWSLDPSFLKMFLYKSQEITVSQIWTRGLEWDLAK